jgi:lipopolysaccharide transport system permease protein
MPSGDPRPDCVSAAPPVVIEPRQGFCALELRELWSFREVIGFLALRDIQIRYKQAIFGVAWVVLQPLLTMVIFTALFGLLLGRDRMPTVEGIPYAVSTYCALVPWQLFATALTASSNSLVNNQNLVSKVYFPRLALPIAPALAALVDFAAGFAVLLGIMVFCGIPPGINLFALPVLVLLTVATALSVSLWLSALNALYHDVRHVLPFVVQLWMFVTPVVYTTSHLLGSQPDWVRVLYGLNPMAGVVEGFRWALLGAPIPSLTLLAGSIVVVSVLLLGGLYSFRRMERSFADWI